VPGTRPPFVEMGAFGWGPRPFVCLFVYLQLGSQFEL